MEATTLAVATPLTLPCGLRLKNRLVKAAMTEGVADPDGSANDCHVTLYRRWANCGCGTLISGNVIVDGMHLERPGNVVLDGSQSAAAVTSLQRWAAAGSENDCRMIMQLSHAGRQTQKKVNPHPRSASAVQLGLPGGQFAVPVPMSAAEIDEVVERFSAAALLAQAAGFAGVQIHAAHGYLLSQFLSPLVNRRDDEWGGSLENRARLLRRIVKAVRERTNGDFAVLVKLNSSDFQKGGFDADDARQVAHWLAADDVDLIEISGGSYEQPRMMKLGGVEPSVEIELRQSTREREAYFEAFAAEMCGEISIPLMVTGGFRSAAAMQEAIAEDGIALVGLGRPLCVAPETVKELLEHGRTLPRHEQEIGNPGGFFGVNSSNSLVRAIAVFSVMAWYYTQLRLLAEGGPARPALGILRCFIALQLRESKWLRERQKAQR